MSDETSLFTGQAFHGEERERAPLSPGGLRGISRS